VLSALKSYGKIDPNQIKLDSNFEFNLGLDSVDIVEIMIAIEDEFAIQIPDIISGDLVQPKLIVDYLCERFGMI
jgi:NADH dehydrogenase (ubiquinone) 1 alpha/beta subcomplex 1